MGYIIGGAIFLGLIGTIIYGLYLLCELIWNTTVCCLAIPDMIFSISLIAIVIIGAVWIVLTIIALAADADGLKFFVFKITLPAMLILGTIGGVIALYGLFEPGILGETILGDEQMLAHYIEHYPEYGWFTPEDGISGSFKAITLFIGSAALTLSVCAAVIALITRSGYMMWRTLRCWSLPSIFFGIGLFGWAVVTIEVLWDYDLFEKVIHCIGFSGAMLGGILTLSMLVRGKPRAAGFFIGLAGAIVFLDYLVYGVFILVTMVDVIWIVLGIVGAYLFLGILYCLTRIKKIKEFIADGVYYYWHK